MLTEIKGIVKQNISDIILVIAIVLISLLSFAAGFIVAKQQEKTPLRIEHYEKQDSTTHCFIS